MPNVQADIDEIRRQHPDIAIDQDNIDKLGRLAVDQHSKESYGDYLAQISAKQELRNRPTGDRPFDSQGPMYDQRTNQLSAQGRAALQARPQTLGQLIGLETGDPRIAPRFMGMGGAPTLGQLVMPAASHQLAPDWAYLSGRG